MLRMWKTIDFLFHFNNNYRPNRNCEAVNEFKIGEIDNETLPGDFFFLLFGKQDVLQTQPGFVCHAAIGWRKTNFNGYS